MADAPTLPEAVRLQLEAARLRSEGIEVDIDWAPSLLPNTGATSSRAPQQSSLPPSLEERAIPLFTAYVDKEKALAEVLRRGDENVRLGAQRTNILLSEKVFLIALANFA
jgi:hypothetical protein